MLGRNVALGDREEAGEARLRGKEVIAIRIALTVTRKIANRKELPFLVVKEPEIGRRRQRPCVLGDGAEAPDEIDGTYVDHVGRIRMRGHRPRRGPLRQVAEDGGDQVGRRHVADMAVLAL